MFSAVPSLCLFTFRSSKTGKLALHPGLSLLHLFIQYDWSIFHGLTGSSHLERHTAQKSDCQYNKIWSKLLVTAVRYALKTE